MVERVIKRDGRKVKFSERRIREAISNAMRDSGTSTYNIIGSITDTCIDAIQVKLSGEPSVEQVQDVIITVLKEMNFKDVANAFTDYRKERTKIRETKSDVMRAISRIGEETERDNANVGNNFSAKLLQIASIANKWHNLALMPKEFSKAHEEGDIHIHDLDSYNLTTNCLLINLKDLFRKGFNTGYGTINTPKRIESAAELACIILQASQNDMFGGQGFIEFDSAFSDIVKTTREEIEQEYLYLDIHASEFAEMVEGKLNLRISQAMQGVVYNLNTMHSRAGSQVPFSSVNIGIPCDNDAALVCKAFLEEYDKGLGKGEQPIFPNIIYRIKDGINRKPGDKYYYLTQLAYRVAGNRMNPTFRLLDSPVNLQYWEQGIIASTMGCRTNILENVNGESGASGRGNIAPVSINLPRIGIESKGDWTKFFKKLNKTMDLCKDQLMHRYDTLKKLKVKDIPFSAGQKLMKGSENLNMDDSIEEILKQGTWAIGFIGLAETMVAMEGHHHGEGLGYWKEADEIMKFMYGKVADFKNETHLNFSLYATPAEGLSGRFVKIDQKKYGTIQGVTDKDYYTNSYHIPVKYNISVNDKVTLEAPFHIYCQAGHITYVEIDGGNSAERARYIEKVINYCYEKAQDMSYIAFNFHIRYCKQCGCRLDESSDTVCPSCGSSNIQGVSRVTGYMSLDERFTPGKVAERADRIKHF